MKKRSLTLPVINQKPHHKAAPVYVRVPLKMPNGKTHIALFTQYEIGRALKRSGKNPEDAACRRFIVLNAEKDSRK